MKQISIFSMSFLLLVSGVSSCGKTTKGKLTNDWKVISYQENTETKAQNGDFYTGTTSMTESTINFGSTFDPVSGTTETSSHTGKVNQHEFIIRKDGTWSYVKEVMYESGTMSDTHRMEQNGTWSFVKKTKGDDFEKNERVLFNILASSETTIHADNQTVTTEYTDKMTQLTGQKILIYTIVNSSKNQLELELESKVEVGENEYMNSRFESMILKSN